MSKETNDGFFLNLLSHLYSADVATLRSSFYSLCIFFEPLSAGRNDGIKAQRVKKNFSLAIRITGVEECDARNGEDGDTAGNIK